MSIGLGSALGVALPGTVILVVTAGAAVQIEDESKQDQEETRESVEVHSPVYKLLRAEEDFTYLRDDSPREKDFFDAIKFIPLNESQSAFLTVGGELRARLELFENPDWDVSDHVKARISDT